MCRVVEPACIRSGGVSTTLVGNVTDSSGSVLPGATVIATHDDTKAAFEVKTNRAGSYSIPFVPVGTYIIMVQASGFRPSCTMTSWLA